MVGLTKAFRLFPSKLFALQAIPTNHLTNGLTSSFTSSAGHRRNCGDDCVAGRAHPPCSIDVKLVHANASRCHLDSSLGV